MEEETMLERYVFCRGVSTEGLSELLFNMFGSLGDISVENIDDSFGGLLNLLGGRGSKTMRYSIDFDSLPFEMRLVVDSSEFWEGSYLKDETGYEHRGVLSYDQCARQFSQVDQVMRKLQEIGFVEKE